MKQSRKDALREVLTGMSIGLVGNWMITASVVSMDMPVVQTATIITIACTVWSFARGYALRRFFDSRLG